MTPNPPKPPFSIPPWPPTWAYVYALLAADLLALLIAAYLIDLLTGALP